MVNINNSCIKIDIQISGKELKVEKEILTFMVS